jgi:hypothetical protein
VPDAVRRLLDKFDYPDRESPTQVIPILPTLGGGTGTGAYIHLTRAATQSIASGGEPISWDTLGTQGVSGFTESVPTTTVTIEQAGYYNIAVQFGWSSFEGGGTITILKNGAIAWAPTDDPGLWSTTDGQFFEGTAPAIDCKVGDVLSVNVNPDDASAQTLASATLAVYLVDRAANESLYRELVLSHGPLGYWRLNETSGTNAADSAGHPSGPFDLTYEGSFTLDADPVMRDGSDDPSVDLTGNGGMVGSDLADFEFAGFLPFTVEAWFVNDLDEDAVSHVLAQKQDALSGAGWELTVAGSSGSRFVTGGRIASGGAPSHGVTSAGGSVVINSRHYVAMTYDGITLSLYFDGTLRDTDTTVVSMGTSTTDLSLGKDAATAAAHFEGREDEGAIYDRALSAAEIGEHYTVGSR